jgi:ribonuclease J
VIDETRPAPQLKAASVAIREPSLLRLTVHRGSREIGGNCVEIATESSRLFIDAGMPLEEVSGRPLSPTKPDGDELRRRGVIKDIPGLFGPGPKVDGILLSHAHVDHYGLLEHTMPQIPVYLSRGASKMLMAGSLFARQMELPPDRQKILPAGKQTRLENSR